MLNLDPAVLSVPFEPNIDIRDSIDYEEVTKQYNLEPNGGILTSLSLFPHETLQVSRVSHRAVVSEVSATTRGD